MFAFVVLPDCLTVKLVKVMINEFTFNLYVAILLGMMIYHFNVLRQTTIPCIEDEAYFLRRRK